MYIYNLNSLPSPLSLSLVFHSRFTFVVCLPVRSADAHRPTGPAGAPFLSVATSILVSPAVLLSFPSSPILPLCRVKPVLSTGDEVAWFRASVRFTCHVLPLSFLHTCISRASHFDQLTTSRRTLLRSLLRFLPSDAIILVSNVLRCFTRRHFDTFESNGALTPRDL